MNLWNRQWGLTVLVIRVIATETDAEFVSVDFLMTGWSTGTATNHVVQKSSVLSR